MYFKAEYLVNFKTVCILKVILRSFETDLGDV